jgi:hypothetical protein
MRERGTRPRAEGAIALAIALACGACGSKGNGASGFSDAGAANEAGVVPSADSGSFCGVTPDCDRDGYTAPADCNDQDPQVNPEAYDFVGDGIDNDCDGVVDDPVSSCETAPAQLPGSPTDFARALDLCAQRVKTNAGGPFDPLVRAAWGQISGLGPGQTIYTSKTKDAQVAIASSFGSNLPHFGKTMIGLANGVWGTSDPRNDPPLDTDPNFHLNDACADIPITGLDCQTLSNGAPAGGVSVQDYAELTLWLKVPANAKGMAFDFAFFSSEFNQYWNASLNDAFLVLVTNKQNAGVNVAKDAHGLGVSVNSGYFQLCPSPAPANLSGDKSAGAQQCVGVDGAATQGVAGSITGTGYDAPSATPPDTVTVKDTQGQDHLYVYGGGTGWLTATFAVTPGEEMQVRVIVFDTFDGLRDSAVVMDGLRWQPTAGSGIVRTPIK